MPSSTHIHERSLLLSMLDNFPAIAPIAAALPPQAWNPDRLVIYEAICQISKQLDPQASLDSKKPILWDQIQSSGADDRQVIRDELLQVYASHLLTKLMATAYCRTIENAYVALSFDSELYDARSLAQQHAVTPLELRARAIKLVDSIKVQSDFYPTSHDLWGELLDAMCKERPAQQFSFGLAPLDDAFENLQPGNFVLIAGRKKGGKTQLALQLMLESAKLGTQSALFSFEMKQLEMMERVASYLSRIDKNRIVKGVTALSIEQQAALAKCETDYGAILDATIIHRLHSKQINHIVAKAHGVKNQFPNLKILVFDYVQKMRSGDRLDMHLQLTDVSEKLKQLAEDLQVVVVGVTQINAHGVTFASSSFEMECDAELLLLDDIKAIEAIDYSEPDADVQKRRCKRIVITNWRNGPSDISYPVTWFGELGRFDLRAWKPEPDNVIPMRSGNKRSRNQRFRADLDA